MDSHNNTTTEKGVLIMSLTQQELHEQILYPVTRVKAQSAGGSGLLVYSKEDPENDGEWINVVLTCQHVVDSAITVKNEWDSLLKREVKKDVMEEVSVEVYHHLNQAIFHTFQYQML